LPRLSYQFRFGSSEVILLLLYIIWYFMCIKNMCIGYEFWREKKKRKKKVNFMLFESFREMGFIVSCLKVRIKVKICEIFGR
jgi:hypothetical protein